eukprot:9360328-Prorocentrum_lima.AAC.1
MDKANIMEHLIIMIKSNLMDKANNKANLKFKFRNKVMLMDTLVNGNIHKRTKELRRVRRLHPR